MLEKEYIEAFIEKNVSVGVPHLILDNRLFFYYGILKSVTRNEITLQTKNGFKIIQIEEIKDIHKNKLDGRNEF